MGHTNTKTFFTVYLKFIFNKGSCILAGYPTKTWTFKTIFLVSFMSLHTLTHNFFIGNPKYAFIRWLTTGVCFYKSSYISCH